MSDETVSRLEYAIQLLEKTSAALDQLQSRMNVIEQQLNPPPVDKPDRLSTKEAAELLGVHRLTLAQYRDQHWQEGIHYFPQAKECLYNRELIDDWQQNRTNPSIHQRAIELWLSRQMGNQKRRKAS